MALCHWNTGSKMTGQAALPHCNIHQTVGKYMVTNGIKGRFYLFLVSSSVSASKQGVVQNSKESATMTTSLFEALFISSF